MSKRPDHFYVQSAVIPYRERDHQIEIALITSRKKKRWVIPKGIHEPGLQAYESAAKEALEEAGVEGRVSTVPLGTYRYRKWGGTCRVEVFTLRVEREYAKWEEDYRDREWVSLEDAVTRIVPDNPVHFHHSLAVKRVEEQELKRIIQSLPQFLKARS